MNQAVRQYQDYNQWPSHHTDYYYPNYNAYSNQAYQQHYQMPHQGRQMHSSL